MTNSKREIIKAKLAGETDKAKILELENELEQLEARQEEENANVAQSNEKIADILSDIKKQTMTKSPACRMDEESFDDCVSRKVPELMDEGYSQEQAIAIASSVCSIPCSEKLEIPKEFEISNAKQITQEINKAIEELNKSNQDNLEKIVATSYKELAEALNKLATKEQKVVVKKEADNIVVNIPTSARKPMAVRLSDGDRFYTAIFSGLAQSNDGVINAINNIEMPDISGLAKESKQLPDNHQVTVSNQITGYATSSNQNTIINRLSGSEILTNTTPLLANQTYISPVFDIKDYSGLSIGVHSNQNSATNGVKFQVSIDGISNWHTTDEYTYLDGNITKVFTLTPAFRYGRVVYTNGPVNQTNFELQVIARPNAMKPSSHRIQDNLIDEDDGELQISVLKLRTAQNSYVSGAATNSGNFKISLEEIETGVVIPVSATSLPLPTGAATEATLKTLQGLSIGEWDKVTQTQAELTDTWAFELASTPTKTVTVTYTDATKGTISTVVLS